MAKNPGKWPSDDGKLTLHYPSLDQASPIRFARRVPMSIEHLSSDLTSSRVFYNYSQTPSVSCYGKNRHRRVEIPEYNNRESGPNSYYFQYGIYVPSERRWSSYHRHRSLPPCARPDAIDIQKQSEYIGLKKKLNHCGGSSLAGNLPGKVPSVTWNSHKRFPQEPYATTLEFHILPVSPKPSIPLETQHVNKSLQIVSFQDLFLALET
ncbi:hypothetical protein ACTXT7_001538 [Hymenolepis weldensis]